MLCLLDLVPVAKLDYCKVVFPQNLCQGFYEFLGHQSARFFVQGGLVVEGVQAFDERDLPLTQCVAG